MNTVKKSHFLKLLHAIFYVEKNNYFYDKHLIKSARFKKIKQKNYKIMMMKKKK